MWIDAMPTKMDGGKLHVYAPTSPVSRQGVTLRGWAGAARFALFLKELYRLPELVENELMFDVSDEAVARMFTWELPPPIERAKALMERTGVRCHWCRVPMTWRAKNGTRRCGGRPVALVWLDDADPTNLDFANVSPICWGCHQRASKPEIPRVNNKFVARAQ